MYCKESSLVCGSWAPRPDLYHLRYWPREDRQAFIRLGEPGHILRIRVLILSHYHGFSIFFFLFFCKSLLELELKFNFLILGKRIEKYAGGERSDSGEFLDFKTPQRSFNDLNVKESETY